MKTEILGPERHRRWSDDEKLAIVSSVVTEGMRATDVAMRHGVSRSQIYGWRRELTRKAIFPAGGGAPARFALAEEAKTGTSAGLVEIILRNGRR